MQDAFKPFFLKYTAHSVHRLKQWLRHSQVLLSIATLTLSFLNGYGLVIILLSMVTSTQQRSYRAHDGFVSRPYFRDVVVSIFVSSNLFYFIIFIWQTQNVHTNGELNAIRYFAKSQQVSRSITFSFIFNKAHYGH